MVMLMAWHDVCSTCPQSFGECICGNRSVKKRYATLKQCHKIVYRRTACSGAHSSSVTA